MTNETKKDDFQPITSKTPIVSNHVGKNGESVDRLYGNPSQGGRIRLVQADYSEYKGNITKVGILVTSSVDKTKFRSYCYKTDDNRWFDRAGLPIDKPSQLIKDNDEKDTLRSEDTHQD